MKDRGYGFLPRISVNRPVTVLMALLAIFLLGAVAFVRLPLQLMPAGFDPAFLSIHVPYPAANPTEVEELIILPLEESLYTIRGLQSVNCRASADSGRCWVEFQPFVDMEETYNAVADRIERLKATAWPDDVERVRIRRHNPESQPVVNIGISLPPGMDDPYWVLTNKVVHRLERVAGVAQVDLEGVREKQIFIEPDRDAMASHKVSPRDLSRSLSRANFAMASGDVDDGGRRMLVRSVARFTSLEQMENLPIRDDGLRLKDVATVRYDHPEDDRVSRLDGGQAASIEIFKESEANTVGVSRAVEAELDQLFKDEPLLVGAGGYNILFDQGDVIQSSISQLRDTGIIGAIFAVVILYIFLRRIRVTLLITLSIPLSLLVCLIVMYFSGATINLITMMGMIICAGMLVDNAVVVVENIDRLRREGRPVREAALAGASEMALALTMATVTTMVVFLPMIIMSEAGMMRFFLLKLSLPVVVAILASLIVALLFLPLAASLLLRSEAERDHRQPGLIARLADRFYHQVMDRLHRLYVRMLSVTLKFRGVTVLLVMLTLLVTWMWPFKQVEVQIQGRHQRGGRQVRFWFNLPNSFGMAQSDDWFRKVEAAFEPKREELAIRHLQTRFWRNRGMVRVLLQDVTDTDVTVEEVIEGLSAVAPTAAGVKMYVNWQRGSGEDASLNVTLRGEDTPTLAGIAEEAERRLRVLPGLTSVEPDLEAAQEELRIRIDRERALQYGVAPEIVSGTVASALRGQQLPRYRTGEKEIEMRVQYSEEDRRGIGNLSALELRSSSGVRIPLDAVADLSIARGFGDIRREDRRTSLNIKLNTTWTSVAGLREQVSRVMNDMGMPRGYSWDFGSARRWEQQDNSNMMFGLLLAMVFIYLIMGFLFESALLPFSVMPSILLSWIGVFWLLWATGSKLDMMAAIGLILLAGVVVNNGIVLVDLINRLRTSGIGRHDAILEAGRLRFRPILMTALTTIMGMLPMAFGKGDFVGIPYSSLGRTFVGGLFSSTTLTLIVVPLFYTLLDDAGAQLKALVSGKRETRPDTPEAETAHARSTN